MKYKVVRRRVADTAAVFGDGGGLFAKMSEHKRYDLVIVGGGPAGYTAAIRAGQLGMEVACVDENADLGGTCLRVGCIPSKTLLESSANYVNARDNFADLGITTGDVSVDLAKLMARKDDVVTTLSRGIDHLLNKYKVERFVGRGRLDGAGKVVVTPTDGEDGKPITLETERVLLATGSRVTQLPGVETDGEYVVTSTEALAFDEVPEHLVVIGGGYIGLELGSVWARLGAKVTVLEYLDRILPGLDSDTARQAQRLFARQGIEFRLGTRVKGTTVKGKQVTVEVEDGESVTADKVLVSIGRTPNTGDLGLETVGIEPDEGGRIPVGDNFETSAEGVYAVGDIIRGPMLAHKAEQEGVACVEAMAGEGIFIDYNAIPAIVFTEPEIAAVGKTEDELKEEGVDYKKGVFSFRGNGRARTLGQVDGQVKVLSDAQTDRILGVHIIGPRAGDLIAEATTAMTFGATTEDLTLVTHAHPTLSEAIKEAALSVHGKVIHG